MTLIENPNRTDVVCEKLSVFFLVFPDEGYYQSGRFQFEIDVPDAYNMVVSVQLFLCLCPKVNLLNVSDISFKSEAFFSPGFTPGRMQPSVAGL